MKVRLASILEDSPVNFDATPEVEDPNKKKPTKVRVAPDRDVIGEEFKLLYNRPLKYDNNRPANEVVLSAAKKTGVDPALLYTSSFQEGMNKAIVRPDERTPAYENAANGFYEFEGVRPRASQPKLDTKNFPVDGFQSYGLDTFGDRLSKLKKYLPAGFESRYQLYDAWNDKQIKDPKTGKLIDAPEKIKTAAFRTNEDALIAKSAMIKDAGETIDAMAAKRGLKLDKKTRDYMVLAAYNSGEGNAKIIMDEYAKAADKNDFIDNGRTSRKGVHKNVAPRLKRMQMVSELLTPKQAAALSASAQAKP